MGAKPAAPPTVVPQKSSKLSDMIRDVEKPLEDVEPHAALGQLQKYMAERAALVSAHHHRELAAAQVLHAACLGHVTAPCVICDGLPAAELQGPRGVLILYSA